jgi:predicted RNA binding protein YcfA (HicA-like mRNA interferase family)
MKYAELARRPRRLGCCFTRPGAGSHEIWRNPATGKQTPVPYHRTKDIGPELLSRILHALDIDRDDFDQAS